MILLPYTIKEKDALLKIFMQNVPDYFAAHEAKEFLAYLNKMPDTYLCIYYNSKLIGGLGYEVRKSDNTGRINWIFIQAEYFGKGIGKQAVEYCLTILKNNIDVKRFVVRTSQLTYLFFEKMGFKTILVQKNYWAKGLDLYEMEKAI